MKIGWRSFLDWNDISVAQIVFLLTMKVMGKERRLQTSE
jgi:hypothetical protein